jgi:hypothetical protein
MMCLLPKDVRASRAQVFMSHLSHHRSYATLFSFGCLLVNLCRATADTRVLQQLSSTNLHTTGGCPVDVALCAYRQTSPSLSKTILDDGSSGEETCASAKDNLVIYPFGRHP